MLAWASVNASELHRSHGSTWRWSSKAPLTRVKPGRRRLSKLRRAAVRLAGGRSLTESTLGVVRRHADQVCFVGARERLAGKGDLRERLCNRTLLGVRTRPEGKIVAVTIAGRAGDLLRRATASW
jgi:hypothetical protein